MLAPPPLLILAGGFGTRLKSVISDVPKPLAPIVGKPFLAYLLEQWVSDGFTQFNFLLHHQNEKIVEFINNFKQGQNSNLTFNWVIEDRPLGTGGAIANALNYLKINDDFIVVNADTFLGKGALSQIAKDSAPSILAVHVDDTSRYGSLQIKDNKVVKFQEKKNLKESGWINAGVYLLNRFYFQNWDMKAYSIESTLLPMLVKSRKLNVSIFNTTFIDIGVPTDYKRFCNWIENNQLTKL